MRIAFLLCSEVVGGHEYQALELYKDLSQKYDVTLFVNSAIDTKRIYIEKYTTSFIKKDIFKQGNFFKQFWMALRKRTYFNDLFNDYDAIIVSAGTIEASIGIGFSVKRKPLYVYVPTYIDRSIIWKNWIGVIYNQIQRLFYLPFKKIITINRIQAYMFTKFRPTVIVPNRIKYINVPKRHTGIRRLYYVGRLEPSKGIIQLIKWLDVEDNPFPQLILVGDGSLRNEIERISKNTKYLRISLIGWCEIEQQEALLSGDDIYITNSDFEGEPLAIKEAHNRGSIVVAKNIVGHRGCTYKRNRFNNQSELLALLKKANNDGLERFINYSPDEVEDSRTRGVDNLFL